jgi:hypothetical protein
MSFFLIKCAHSFSKLKKVLTLMIIKAKAFEIDHVKTQNG